MNNTLKAWCVFSGEQMDGCLLVYAPTRNKARQLGFKRGPYQWGEYIYVSARRAPEHDVYAVGIEPYVIETNDELPNGAKAFYWEDEF